MIRRIITIAFSLAIALSASAQNASSARYASHSKLAQGKWVKIRVAKEGVYSLSRSKLAQMGFSNPDKVCLYGYNMPLLPETKLEKMSDDLTEIPLFRKSDGSVLFYSCGTTQWSRTINSALYRHKNNPYSSYIYYLITESTDSKPADMPKDTVASSATYQTVNTFNEHVVIEKDEISMLNSGRTFYEAYNYASGNKKSYQLNLPGIASPAVSITTQFVATNNSTVTVAVEDTTIATSAIRAVVQYEYGVQVARQATWRNNSLKEKASVTITHNRTTGVSGHLDYITANYSRRLDLASSKYLAFRPSTSGAKKFEISGANQSTRVWRVTTPATTCELTGSLANGILSAFTNVNSVNEEYVAVNTNATFPEPEVVGKIANQDLHSLKDIDYVIIVPAKGHLTAQAQRLADAHTAKDSMRCVVVRADQIYNEFSSGTPDATAYRRFMKMLYDKASTPADRPKNLCLFGPGVWDNRMITTNMQKFNPNECLLVYESDNSLSHTDSYVLEEYFTLLADGKGVSPLKEKPDCGVGRIPASTAKQARGAVDKLIAYINNANAGAWKNTICVMADDGNDNIHMESAEKVADLIEKGYPDYRMRKVYWDSYNREESGAGHSYKDAFKDIDKQMYDGALIMNYTGHGSAYCLSHEQVLLRAHFAEWNSPRLPLWFVAACDVTPFDMNEDNIAETALMNPNGAAMGFITTTRTVYSPQNLSINLAFTRNVLSTDENGRQYSIGEALSLAKGEIASAFNISKRDSLNKCHYVLIGDPAISLPVPTYKVKVDKLNGKDVSDQDIQTIGAGAIAKVQGHIVDEDGNPVPDFNGIVSPVVFDNLEEVTCNNNSRDDVQPMKFMSRTRTLFAGNDSIRNGQFEFEFPIPLDINYSDDTGLMCFYAINDQRNIEANGNFHDFAIGGTDPNLSTDKQGPLLAASLNGVVYTNNIQGIESLSGADSLLTNIVVKSDVTMHETPFFIGAIHDDNGINTIGSGIGHEITVIIDNDPLKTFNLNRTFEYASGSWKDGTVYCSLPELTTGTHTLLFRAWDMLNNPSTLEIEFDVLEGLKPNILDLKIAGPVRKNQLTVYIENDRPQSDLNIDVKIYDMTGREVWHGGESGASSSSVYTYTCNLNLENGHLQPGIYICKASISTANGVKASKSKKFMVSAQ